ncbi:MAG: hypothetical protein R2789_11790 [Microthrixaceae bacterium]
MQDVRLVLVVSARLIRNEPSSHLHDPSVMARGNRAEPEEIRSLQEHVELEVPLHSTHGFGVRPAAVCHVGRHDMVFELVVV